MLFMPGANTPQTPSRSRYQINPSNSIEQPIVPPELAELSQNNTRSGPAFHLLIPASETKASLCKTLLSAFVLGYPAPTLINWGKSFGEAEDEWAHSHTAKIRGVLSFVDDKSKVKDDDLVLIVDGYDVWFQLPAHLLVERYHQQIKTVNGNLRSQYGMMLDPVTELRVQKYQQRVIFGADKICWPNPREDPACSAVPYSTLPEDAYGPQTDQDPEGFNNRPRWLNSGNVIGTVAHVRDIYRCAIQKVDQEGRGDMGDQLVFAQIFGEQEYQRETQTIASASSWRNYITKTLGLSKSPLATNVTINNMTVTPGQRYEYSIGLDYESKLFQTMTHSIDDIAFVVYNSSEYLASVEAAYQALHSSPLYLPSDLQAADPPCTYVSPGNRTEEKVGGKATLLLPYSPALDNIPSDPADPRQPSWRSIPLATNIRAASVPVLLHVNGDKSILDTWWLKMWFHPYSRALLRRFIRSTQTTDAAYSASGGGLGWWNTRGGRGGVWTDNDQWMAWTEVCKGSEDEIFMDGKGVFGKEEGDGRVVNSFGKTLVGDDE